MKITQDFGNAAYIIRGYEEGVVIVNETRYTRSLIIMPEYLNPAWAPQDLDMLAEQHLQEIVDQQPELVILGTGARLRFPGAQIQAYFLTRRIGVEFMDTPAACRTYNILMSEGRRVACALLIGTRDR